jgi:hypothetical protein
MNKNIENELSCKEVQFLLTILENRFHQNILRHPDLNWSEINASLIQSHNKLWLLHQMEITKGEPDVLSMNEESGSYFFYDCAPESPKERRSICYDKAGLDARKDFKPENNAIDMANEMCIEILDKSQYRFLQTLGAFDLKTSSWLKSPSSIRKLDGAIFGDRRYDQVFVYHNGASSYYAARGFRGVLEV